MGAFNILKYRGLCPSCGQRADMEIQLHAAASFESDENGRLANRIYRVGDLLQWWPKPHVWREVWSYHHKLVKRGKNTYEEESYGDCLNCGASIACTVTYVGMRITGVADLRVDE